MKVIPLFQCSTEQKQPKQPKTKPSFEDFFFRAMANERSKHVNSRKS
jgi:hypothetical protein